MLFMLNNTFSHSRLGILSGQNEGRIILGPNCFMALLYCRLMALRPTTLFQHHTNLSLSDIRLTLHLIFLDLSFSPRYIASHIQSQQNSAADTSNGKSSTCVDSPLAASLLDPNGKFEG
jgi:hypothetical protein